MSDKELFQLIKQSQIKEWLVEVDRLKTNASCVKVKIQQRMNKKIRLLESKIKEANEKLSLLAETSEDVWESFRNITESASNSLKFVIGDSFAKFNK